MAARRLRLERTLGPVVVRWIEANLVHGPGDVQGQPVELDDEQVRFLLRAYEIDRVGKRLVRRAVYSRPKGRAKSEFAAMIACAEALGPVRFRGWDEKGRPLGGPITAPLIRFAATEEGQAGDVYEAARFMLTEGAVSATPGLDVGLTRTFLPGGGKLVPVTAKAKSKDGGKETFVVFDETHLYNSPELVNLHNTIRRNLGKRKEAQPWSLETTTAYAPGEGSVAEYSHAQYKKITQGKIANAGFLFDHRSGPSDFDFGDDEQLRAAMMEAYGEAVGWMDFDRLIAEARDEQSDRGDVMRYFVNVPYRREELLFIKKATWDALADPDAVVAEGDDACLGIDGSRTFDTTVVGWSSTPDEDDVVTVGAHVFSVRREAPHHTLHEAGSIDYDDVEGFIVDRFDYLHVAEAAYDPRYLDRSADILDSRLPESVIFAVEPSSKLMREALQTLERVVLEGKLRHNGDPVIGAHFANAKVDRGPSGEIRRVTKLDERKPIDAVIALALAVWRATHGVSSVYEDREMLTL